MSEVRRLLATRPGAGRLVWIGLSSARRGEVRAAEWAEVVVGTGLVGDHHASRGGGRRQVTLCQAEHLSAIASFLGRDAVRPEDLRRNLLVEGINLLALKDRRFRIGEVELEGTGPCAPCSRMEETLGPGGFQATRGHGGITARVLTSGQIRLGDPIEVVVEEPASEE